MRVVTTSLFASPTQTGEPEPSRERDRRDAPAGTWQAVQAERQRQAASHLPSHLQSHPPSPRRQETAAEQRRTPPGDTLPARSDPEAAPDVRVEARQSRQDGNGREGGGREPAAAVATQAMAPAARESLQAEVIEGIAALAPGQDLFELLLPGGQRLGVLLAPAPDRVLHILLSCSDDGLRRTLDEKSMELERGLARRMQQATRVTVL